MTEYTKKPNIAIVGLGNWGKKLALGFSKHTNIIYATNKESKETEKWIRENLPNTKIEKDLDKVLSDNTIDAVVIATPIETHYDIALKCIEANKDIFIEKPTCNTSEKIRNLIRATERTSLIVFTGFIYLHNEAYQKMLRLIEGQKIKEISFSWQKYGSFGNSIFLNLLSHNLAMSIKLLGYPKEINVISKKETDGEINVLELKTKHGDASAHYYIDRVSDTKRKTISIKTSSEEYFIENNTLYKSLGDKKEIVFKSKKTSIESEVLAFIKNIKERTTPYSDNKLSLDVAKVLEQIT